MKAKHAASAPAKQANQMSESPASNKDLLRRLARLEDRAALHAEILNFVKTIADQLKESGTLELTETQHAQMNEYLEALKKTH